MIYAKPRRGWAGAVAATVVAVVLVRTFAVQVYGITTPSMSGTLRPGDFVITSNAAFGAAVPGTPWTTPRFRDPRHGEVVVYAETPGEPPARVIKRVIGLPGDTIQMVRRQILRNGVPLDERYVARPSRDDAPLAFDGPYGVEWHRRVLPSGTSPDTYRPTRDSWGPLVVPPGQYLLLGDNRDESTDSRMTGFVARERIRGNVAAIYYSVAPDSRARFPALTAARWTRIGRVR